MVQAGYGAYRLRDNLYHIRAIVDDYYVVRTWSKRRQDWIYSVQSINLITDLIATGTAQKVKTRAADND